MLAIVLRGLPGSGKSTLAKEISRQLRLPLIDKDDIRDVLDEPLPDAGRLAYDIWLQLIDRQLRQGLSVVCDSPLTFSSLYEQLRSSASRVGANLAVIQCECADDRELQQRIEARPHPELAIHRMAEWKRFTEYRREYLQSANYDVRDPLLIVSTLDPLPAIVDRVIRWLCVVDPSLRLPDAATCG